MSAADPAAAKLRAELEETAATWLAPAIDRLVSGRAEPRPTIVNDPLWGSIRLFSWEVALLDTKLMQRLRFLRQLGVVHWVFPAAGHSRLEHSLGVLHQMQELLDGLERNSGTAGERIVDDVTVKLLRLAALLHDSGHVVMSHVPEKIIESLPGVDALRNEVHANLRSRKRPSASEAFAVCFVQSPAFQKFLGTRAVGADFIQDVSSATGRIASFLVGGAGAPGEGFLSLLMNGAFDADKLDYMPRDCLMAGVPCAVDVERVIEKVQCLAVPADKLPSAYTKWSPPRYEGELVRVLALSKSGKRALNEIAITRTLLYEKVYYHHKVRALECAVRRLLEKYRSAKVRSLRDWLELSDDDVLRLEFPEADALRNRQLLKRAFFIVPVSDPAPLSPPDVKKAWRGWLKVRSEYASGSLASEVRSAMSKIAADLGMVFPSDGLEPEVDFPDQTKTGLDQFAFIGDGLGDFGTPDVGHTGERPESGKRVASTGGYVFAPEGFVLPAFLAARAVLANRYDQTYDEECYASTKLDPEDIERAQKRLEETSALIRGTHWPPIPAARLRGHREIALETFLKVAWPRIERLGVRFGQYQSPDGAPISPKKIAAFLRQFETQNMARPALRLLESLDFKDRAFFSDALRSAIAVAGSMGEITCVCPFGATGDSSAFITYVMNDLPPELRRPVQPLELALDRDRLEGILLWDDFCGRGGHSVTALSQWLEQPPPPHALDEFLVDPLSPQRSARFRAVPTFIAFGLAITKGLDWVQRYSKEIGLAASVLGPHVEVPQRDEFIATSATLGESSERLNLQTFLRERGRILMEEAHGNATKVAERLLGYGNGGHRLVFNYNVPTVTITALWASGKNWTALFPRRKKPPRASSDNAPTAPVPTQYSQ